jgi:hypothetical protein
VDRNLAANVRNSVDIVQQRWNDWVIEYGARQQSRLFAPFGFERATPAMLVSLLFLAIAAFGAILFPIVLRIREAAGISAQPSTGALELAAVASLGLPQHAASIQRIANLYTRCRYACEPPPVPELQEAVSEFRPTRKSA